MCERRVSVSLASTGQSCGTEPDCGDVVGIKMRLETLGSVLRSHDRFNDHARRLVTNSSTSTLCLLCVWKTYTPIALFREYAAVPSSNKSLVYARRNL